MRLDTGRPVAALIIPFALLILLALMPQHAGAQTAGHIEGSLPPDGGFALVVWTGGSLESLIAVAHSRGCEAKAGWTTADGALVAYIHGAPAVVNADFFARFASGSIPPGTALVLDCSTETNVPSAASAPPPALSLDQQFGAATFDAINATRERAGRAPLNANQQLRSAAEKYVRTLIDTGRLHHGMDGQPWDRAQRENYPSATVGEVIASAATSEALDVPRETGVLVDTWLNSPPHRDIIMGTNIAFEDLGVGCATGHDSGGLNLVVCVAMTGQP